MESIAVAISTRNRPGVYRKSLAEWIKNSPSGVRFFVVDDATDANSMVWYDFRFEERAGIPRVKNKCLELAYNSGVSHIFLADDDVYPAKNDWYEPYIKSGVPHLSYCFTEGYAGTPTRQKPAITPDGRFTVNAMANGCMLYFTRECIEKAGGFDERFGMGTYEHQDLTRRIYNMGLTPFPNMDVVGSDQLFVSLDRLNQVKRSFSHDERLELIDKNVSLYVEKENDTTYIEFRDGYKSKDRSDKGGNCKEGCNCPGRHCNK